MITIGEKIKRLRKSKGVTSRDLSTTLGKSSAYISQIELGRVKNPDKDIVIKILEALSVDHFEIIQILNEFDISNKANNKRNNINIENLTPSDFLTEEQLNEKYLEDAENLATLIKTLPKKTTDLLFSLLEDDGVKVKTGESKLLSNKKQNIILKDVLEVKDIQEYLNIGRRQAYELIESGKFHSVRIGKKIKVSRDVFEEWLKSENS